MSYYRRPLIDKRPKCDWCGWRGKEEQFKRVRVGFSNGVYYGEDMNLCPYCQASHEQPYDNKPTR